MNTRLEIGTWARMLLCVFLFIATSAAASEELELADQIAAKALLPDGVRYDVEKMIEEIKKLRDDSTKGSVAEKVVLRLFFDILPNQPANNDVATKLLAHAVKVESSKAMEEENRKRGFRIRPQGIYIPPIWDRLLSPESFFQTLIFYISLYPSRWWVRAYVKDLSLKYFDGIGTPASAVAAYLQLFLESSVRDWREPIEWVLRVKFGERRLTSLVSFRGEEDRVLLLSKLDLLIEKGIPLKNMRNVVATSLLPFEQLFFPPLEREPQP